MDIDEIAEGLSEAQRAALLAHKEKQQWGGRHDRYLPCYSDVGIHLRRLGLIRFGPPRTSYTLLTPLGQQVRAHLENSK